MRRALWGHIVVMALPVIFGKQLDEARRQVASIREEFRKYRVKAELSRKQREAEVK